MLMRNGSFYADNNSDTAEIEPYRVDRHFVATRPNQLWVSDFTS